MAMDEPKGEVVTFGVKVLASTSHLALNALNKLQLAQIPSNNSRYSSLPLYIFLPYLF